MGKETSFRAVFSPPSLPREWTRDCLCPRRFSGVPFVVKGGVAAAKKIIASMLHEQLDGQLRLAQLDPLQGQEFPARKRDGRVVPFEETRIQIAIESAFKADATLFRECVQHVADRRLERIGLEPRFGAKNPFPWMSETIDLGKEKNFFETRVTEYQTDGSLAW